MLEKEKQIIQTHAAMIRAVVEACHRREQQAPLDAPLRSMTEAGWGALVTAIRLILGGRRDSGVLQGLDDEDAVIAGAILSGLQNPATLPDAQAASGDARVAAPGLAGLIDQAGRGDAAALVVLGDMGEQMARSGGEMARVAAVLRPLINGERDPDVLTRHLGPRGKGLVLSILDELARRQSH
jgi:hypothetical protein